MMKTITYAPLALALLVGLVVALLSQPVPLFWSFVVFACATMIAFGMLSCIWFIIIFFLGGLENE